MTYISIIKMFVLLPIIVTGMYVASIFNKQQPQPELKQEIAKVVDQKQLQCLADNIYHEAGSEILEGKAAVARVVLNRISHGGFGNTPCKVVYQITNVKQINEDTLEEFWVKICQFSWVCENKSVINRNTNRYQSSLQVAYDVLAYNKYEEVIPKSVLFFHNKSFTNEWPHTVVKTIGNHIFYEKKRTKKVKKREKTKQHRYFDKPRSAQVQNGEISEKVDREPG